MTDADTTQRLGIAVASGMLKGVYGHGVLSAFEERGLRAQVYGAASSSGLSGGLAAIGHARQTGVDYWIGAAGGVAEKGMSRVALDSIEEYGPLLREGLFRPGAPEFLLATSKVTNAAAAETTQGPGAKALGKELLRNVFSGDRSWVQANLAAAVFSSHAEAGGEEPRLTAENYDAVAYASTRMLHAWALPAEVGGEAYVDASYTCSCPAREVAAKGVSVLIAVGNDPFPLFRDLYASEEVADGSVLDGAQVLVIKPEEDLKHLGVDYAAASPEGLVKAYERGLDEGHRFVERHAGLLGAFIAGSGGRTDGAEEAGA
ncbi:hypothetical protein RI138_00355 [Streptomyces sp. C11-1]|uniref:PNPLA domain-containing protein n=1 Tax=Streptomyces durocortorensis TaxID=2811104 RepID=A0ABY9VP70_9ACTN|nr:hypothetical protein [Streptomyces durocortorensis]WNF25373.1 hypothetical protein RI138_00355 [Streptomyces durocortorensis]